MAGKTRVERGSEKRDEVGRGKTRMKKVRRGRDGESVTLRFWMGFMPLDDDNY